MSLPIEITVAIIVAAFALISSVAAFVYGWVNVAPLRDIINELKKDIEARKERERLFEARNARYLKRIIYLTEGIRVLLEQIKRHRETPCWTPVDWDPDEEERSVKEEKK